MTSRTSLIARTLAAATAALGAALGAPAAIAQDRAPNYEKIPPQITTPGKVDTRIGRLTFRDGYPIKGSARKLADEIDYLHGVQAFKNSIQGVSIYAVRKGFLDAGIRDNDVFLTSRLLDAKSLLLTGNADTVYYVSFIDLSKGPMVVETPPGALGIFDDMWFHWIVDFGLAGPDRGRGGKFLLVPPGYKGLLPEEGYFVRKSRTFRVVMLGRSFLQNNDPAPTVAIIKKHTKIYPYKPGGYGTTIASYLEGKAPLTRLAKPVSPRFVEGTGLAINTIPPNDFGHYEMLDALVQLEPAEALDAELAGQFAAIGIVKGKKFAPDARMRKILEKSVAIGNAAARVLGMGAHPEDHFRYYGKSSAWWNMLFTGGYKFLNPPPMILPNGAVKQFPNRGARQLNARTGFFYTATGITPAMVMRLTNIGSQYLIGNLDSKGAPFDGAKTYKLDLPRGIPAVRFWSATVYDNQTRSMLQTPQRYPRAGSQSFPSPAAVPNSDGLTTIYFAPKKPKGVKRGNWIQTVPGKGWFVALRFYSPTKGFFDKSWRPGEVTLVK